MFVRCGVAGFWPSACWRACRLRQSAGLDSVVVSPTSQTLTVGQTAQFSATGPMQCGHASTQNITDGVTWSSSTPAVATIGATGWRRRWARARDDYASAAGSRAGCVQRDACGCGYGAAQPGLDRFAGGDSGSQTVAAPTQTSQFIAIGTTSSGAT